MLWVDKEYNVHDYEWLELNENEMYMTDRGCAESNYELPEFLEYEMRKTDNDWAE